jgi:phosphatidate phosphatase PAH1
LVPSQENLQELKLNDGENVIAFEMENSAIYAPLFVWPQSAKIVVIDIEGAITVQCKNQNTMWGTFLGKVLFYALGHKN